MTISAEQIAERRGYLGGSDVAAALGLSRWRTPLQVWGEKTGLLAQEDKSNSLPIEVGNELEDLVAKLWTKRTGKALRRVNKTLRHHKYPYLGANIDREVVGEDSIFEAKTCGAWTAKEFAADSIPQEYIVQAMHYLTITGAERCYVAVLVGGNADFRMTTVERNPQLQEDLTRRAVEFWTKYVEPRVMPQVIKRDDSETLYRLFPEGQDGEELQLGEDADRLADSIKAMQADYKQLQELLEAEKNRLKAMLKDQAAGRSSRYRISWRNQIKKAYTVPESSGRVLRISEIAKEETGNGD